MNILFWHPVILYQFPCLSYLSTAALRVCSPAVPPTSLPVPFAHYLSPSGFDWIFSRGRNVSTKWIRRNIAFRQARSNFSFNKREHLSSLPSSQAFRTCWALPSLSLSPPPLPFHEIFEYIPFFFLQKCLPKKRIRYPHPYHILATSLYLKVMVLAQFLQMRNCSN